MYINEKIIDYIPSSVIETVAYLCYTLIFFYLVFLLLDKDLLIFLPCISLSIAY